MIVNFAIMNFGASALVIWTALLTDINKRISLFLTLLPAGARKTSYIPSLPYNHKSRLISWEPGLLLGWPESPIATNT